VQKRYADIQQAGGEVLVVSFTPPSRVAAYLAKYPQPFPVVSDPELTAYKKFGLERTSVRKILSPGVLVRFIKLIFRGWLPHKPGEGEDVLQLGGDFILDVSGSVRYAHPSTDPSDRPPVQELVDTIRSLL
jgi:peroxiredoxin